MIDIDDEERPIPAPDPIPPVPRKPVGNRGRGRLRGVPIHLWYYHETRKDGTQRITCEACGADMFTPAPTCFELPCVVKWGPDDRRTRLGER